MTYRTATIVYPRLEDRPILALEQQTNGEWKQVMSTMDRQYYFAYCNRARIRTTKKYDITITESE